MNQIYFFCRKEKLFLMNQSDRANIYNTQNHSDKHCFSTLDAVAFA